MLPPRSTIVAAPLALLLAALPAAGQTHGPVVLPPDQSAAAERLAGRLVDGDLNRQVFTADHAARLCYRAARANSSNAHGTPDRDGLTAARHRQFTDCVEQSGYRLDRR